MLLVLFLMHPMVATSDVAIATVIAALIAGLAGWATARTSAKSEVRRQETASRTDIEKEAFQRAKDFYTDTIDRQAKQIDELEDDVDGLKKRATEADTEIGRLRQELDVAKRALRLAFPDEI